MGVETVATRGARPVITAGLEFVSQLFGIGGRTVAPTLGRTGTAASRAAAAAAARLAAQRAALAGGAGLVGGAIVGGTLLDDIGPDLAAQLMAAGIDPTQFRRKKVKGPDIVVDPVTGARFRRIKKRRSRGISATELRGFRRVTDLLVDVGLAPRKIPTAAKRSRRKR